MVNTSFLLGVYMTTNTLILIKDAESKGFTSKGTILRHEFNSSPIKEFGYFECLLFSYYFSN